MFSSLGSSIIVILGVLGRCPGVNADCDGVDGAALSMSISSSAKLKAKDIVKIVGNVKLYSELNQFSGLVLNVFGVSLRQCHCCDALIVRIVVRV